MAYITEGEDTPWLPFDKLGVETLVVDEAHNYKNIPLQSRADNIVGMHSQGSKKCKEMLEKSRVVKKLIFATGTPLTNSLSDLFVLQTYLQADELKFRGILRSSAWTTTNCSVRPAALHSPASSRTSGAPGSLPRRYWMK